MIILKGHMASETKGKEKKICSKLKCIKCRKMPAVRFQRTSFRGQSKGVRVCARSLTTLLICSTEWLDSMGIYYSSHVSTLHTNDRSVQKHKHCPKELADILSDFKAPKLTPMRSCSYIS